MRGVSVEEQTPESGKEVALDKLQPRNGQMGGLFFEVTVLITNESEETA
jgi:hypothetical protein